MLDGTGCVFRLLLQHIVPRCLIGAVLDVHELIRCLNAGWEEDEDEEEEGWQIIWCFHAALITLLSRLSLFNSFSFSSCKDLSEAERLDNGAAENCRSLTRRRLRTVLLNCSEATIEIDLQQRLLFDTDEACFLSSSPLRVFKGNLFIAEP